ncbi:MAG: hypothetical protein ACLU9S_11450 [Oscillospiraceae bacterium]
MTYVTYTTDGSVVLGSDTTGYTVPASGSQTLTFSYTPTQAKVMTVTVTVGMELDGVDYEFTMDVELDVLNAEELLYALALTPPTTLNMWPVTTKTPWATSATWLPDTPCGRWS